MKKVLQENVDKGSGDCARAAIASLFDKELNEVPEFFPDGSQLWEITKYFESQGYKAMCYNKMPGFPTLQEAAKHDGGVNGFFYASVYSQIYDDTSHAVIVDVDMNIVHDPNPNQLAMKLSPEDVESIIAVKDWYITKEGEFI